MLWKEITIENYNLSNQYLGDFKLTPYLTNIFNNDDKKCFEALAFNSQELIDAYLNYAITNFPFDTLLPIQKQLLIKAVFYQINHILYNVLPIERTEDQSVSVPNSVSVNLQMKQFIFSPDALSTRTKELCEATGLRYMTLDKEKYIESRISELPNIFNTYTIKDLQNLNCNYYYFLPVEKGVPKLSLINFKLDNAISGFLQKLDDYSYKLICLYYSDLKNKIESIVESILYINFDKKPINIGDDGAKWITTTNTNKYIADGKTIEIDSNNIVSSIGVIDKNTNKVGSAKEILDTIQKSTDNKTNIDNINSKINDISLNLEKKVDKNNLKEDLISSDLKNDLILGSDNKLFVRDSGSGEDKYYGDGKTIEINSNNIVSSIGVLSGHTDIPVITGDNLYKLRTEVADNVKTLEEVEKELKNNETKIANNTTSISNNNKLIATNKENIEINRQSIKNNQDFINNKCVKKDALNEIIVSKKDKPDNILQALNGNQLYVPKPSDTTLQWKQFAENNEYAREIEEGNHYRCKYNGSKQFEDLVFYDVFFWFSNLEYTLHFQFLYMIGNSASFCIYGWNKATSKKTLVLAWFEGQDICYEKMEGNLVMNVGIYELKTAYLKPLPILTKRNIYKTNKKIWKMEDFND